MNYGFDRARQYFEKKFGEDLAEFTSEIPDEQIVEPKPFIAAPILQGIAFTVDEPSLKELFLKLLSSSMDARSAQNVHPAFVDIVRQLSPGEASLLVDILKSGGSLPIVQIRENFGKGKGYITKQTNVMRLLSRGTKELVSIEGFGAMVDNWVRLGLIQVSYDEHLTEDSHYSWVEESPQFVAEKEAYRGEASIVFQKGMVRVTQFGKAFVATVT